MGTLTATIQGSSVDIIAGSFRSSDTVNNRPTASFSLYYTGTPPGDEGDEVVVTRTSDASVLFAGRIMQVNERVDEANTPFASYSIGGYETYADRRIVAEVYRNRTAGFIVADLVTKYLAADGVTAGTIQDGVTIPSAVFGYLPLADVLRRLADASGYIWRIDTAKALHFTERDFAAAPYDIEFSATPAVRSVSAQSSLTQYRNRQYIQYNELTSERTERFAGDGLTQTFTVEFPIAESPTVRVNQTQKTVGIAGLGNGSEWYWNKGSNQVAQDIDAAPPGTVESLEFVPVAIDTQAFSSFSARGNYGIGVDSVNNTIYLFNVTSELASVAQVVDPSVDDIHAASWIDDEYFAMSYTDSGSDYISIYRRVGGSIVAVGTPLAATDETWLSPECSNGQYLAAHVRNAANALELYKFDKVTETLTLEDTESGGGGAQSGYAAWFGDFLAFASGGSQNVYVYKLDRTADTLTQIYAGNEGLGQQLNSVAWVSNYLYAGFTSASFPANRIVLHSLDVSTDTVTRIGTATAQTAPNTYHIVSIGEYIVVAPITGVQSYDYYKADLSDGSLSWSGAYSKADQATTISLAVSRNIGNNFIFGVGGSSGQNLFILRPSPAVIEVTYRGTFPNVSQIDDFAEQAARQAAEGGTGLYEAFQNASQVDGEPQAIDVAQAIIERYGRIPKVFQCQTRLEGYAAGQVVTVDWPALGISDEEFLIETVSAADVDASVIWYTLRCLSGRDIGNWQEFWRSLRPSSSFDFGGSETLPLTRAAQDMVMIADEATAVSAAAETNWDEGNWDQMEWQ